MGNNVSLLVNHYQYEPISFVNEDGRIVSRAFFRDNSQYDKVPCIYQDIIEGDSVSRYCTIPSTDFKREKPLDAALNEEILADYIPMRQKGRFHEQIHVMFGCRSMSEIVIAKGNYLTDDTHTSLQKMFLVLLSESEYANIIDELPALASALADKFMEFMYETYRLREFDIYQLDLTPAAQELMQDWSESEHKPRTIFTVQAEKNIDILFLLRSFVNAKRKTTL